MKKLLLSAILFSGLAFGQETEFKMTPQGFTDYVVTQKDGKTAAELYNKTIEWIKHTYNSPDSVIMAKTENEYVRIEGITDHLAVTHVLGTPFVERGKYQVEISFKDGKYKFDVSQIQLYSEPNKYSAGGWHPLAHDFSFYYRGDQVKPMFRDFPVMIPAYFNQLNKSLSDYIDGTGVQAKKNDW